MSYNSVQRNVGYGPPGRFYDYALVIESQQPCGNKIEIELIIDDRLRTGFISYKTEKVPAKTVKLTDYDRDRALKYAILSLPASAREVVIECIDDKGPITEQCCVYNLYDCSFSPYRSLEGHNAPGKYNEKGADLVYGSDSYKDSYHRKQDAEKSSDTGFFARLVSFSADVTFLVMRCYLGAMLAQNLGFKNLDYIIAGAAAGGLISEHTLGSVITGIFSSGFIKAGLIFSPVCVCAYFAVQPQLFSQVMYDGVEGNLDKIIQWFASLTWLSRGIQAATLWATAGLMLIGMILSILIPEDKTEKNPDDFT